MFRPSPVALSSRWAGEAIIRRKQPTRHARGHKKITTAAVAGVPPTREIVCRLFFEEERSESAERRAIWNATCVVVRTTPSSRFDKMRPFREGDVHIGRTTVRERVCNYV